MWPHPPIQNNKGHLPKHCPSLLWSQENSMWQKTHLNKRVINTKCQTGFMWWCIIKSCFYSATTKLALACHAFVVLKNIYTPLTGCHVRKPYQSIVLHFLYKEYISMADGLVHFSDQSTTGNRVWWQHIIVHQWDWDILIKHSLIRCWWKERREVLLSSCIYGYHVYNLSSCY